jgi:hypothetical protein
MNALMWLAVALASIGVIIIICLGYCACALSSQISREEEHERQ